MSHDQRGTVGDFNNFGGGVGLARSRDTEQNLVLLAIENASGESLNGLPLVTLGLVNAYQLKVHISIIWDKKRGDLRYLYGRLFGTKKTTDGLRHTRRHSEFFARE